MASGSAPTWAEAWSSTFNSTFCVRAISRKLCTASCSSSASRAGLDVETLLARFHPRQGQQVFGQARHAQGALADDLKKIAGVIVVRRTVEQSLGVTLNGSQRRAQFVRDVGDKVATRLLHSLGFGKVAQHRHGAAARHGCSGDIEGPSGNDGRSPGSKHSARLARSSHRSQEIRIANGLHQGGIFARALRNQFVHGLVGPLHAIIGTDRDDGVLHAVEQGFELMLAGLQRGKAFFQMAGGLVERGGNLADFVLRSFLDARRQVSGSDPVGETARCAASAAPWTGRRGRTR